MEDAKDLLTKEQGSRTKDQRTGQLGEDGGFKVEGEGSTAHRK